MSNQEVDLNENKKNQKSKIFSDFILPIIIGLLIVFILRYFVFGLYYVPSGSMIPTLEVNDHVVVTYHTNDLKRGDIVVFTYPVEYKETGKKINYVKRLIGLPKDKLEIKDNKVYVNDVVLEETYLASDTNMPNFGPINLGENEYFMMGDNRNHSNDSRYWGIVPEELLIGKAQVIYWPLSRVRLLG